MSSALPPATLEGWYVLHQVMSLDGPALRDLGPGSRDELAAGAAGWFEERGEGDEGWSAAFQLVGAGADLLLLHFRPTLDGLGEAELALKRSPLGAVLRPEYTFLSVTEAGLYHATAEAAAAHPAGSEAFHAAVREAAAAELASPHVQSRLYPRVPAGMRYVSFYPMTKRRTHPDNWYTLPVAERSRLMREHGLTGRRYAGRVFQVISGSIGLDDWEWGVTLFARDPLEFKRLVTEMRFDEASARYGEFGRFFTGMRLDPEGWPAVLAGE